MHEVRDRAAADEREAFLKLLLDQRAACDWHANVPAAVVYDGYRYCSACAVGELGSQPGMDARALLDLASGPGRGRRLSRAEAHSHATRGAA